MAVATKIGGSGTFSGSLANIAGSITTSASVGDLVIVGGCWAIASKTITTVTDTQSNTWNIVNTAASASESGGFAWSILTTALTGGSDTVTMTLNSAGGGRCFTAIKIPAANLAASPHDAPADNTKQQTGTAITITTGSTLAQAGEYVITFDLLRSSSGAPTWTWTSGTQIDSENSTGTATSGLAIGELDNTVGTSAVTMSFTGKNAADVHGLGIIAFKTASANQTVSPPAATASASAPIPTVTTSGGPQTVSPPAATASASSLVPTVSTAGGATGLLNNAEGGTNGTTVTTGNSGGASGDAFTAVGGTPTFSTTQVAHGSLAYSLSAAAMSLTWTQTSAADGYGRAYVYLAASGASFEAAGFLTGSAKWRIIFGTAQFIIQDSAFTTRATGTTPTTGQWYRLEWHHNSASQLEVKVWNSMDSSGAPDQDLTAASSTNSNVDQASYFPSQNFQLYLDELNGFATAWPGPAGGASNQTVSPAAASATASSPTPTIQLQIAPAAATAAASAPIPVPQLRIGPAAATASASAPLPVPQLKISPAAATATASSPVPVIPAIVVPVATASANSPPPGLAVTVLAPAATAAASAPLPAVQLKVSPAAATAAASAAIPGIAVRLTPAAASATASAPTPIVTTAPVVAPPAATAAASAPTPQLQLRIPVPVATAAASAPIPIVTTAPVVAPPAGTATASAPTPQLQLRIPIPAATATASALVPVVTAGAAPQTVSPPVATATASAFVPTLQLQVSPPAAAATASAPTPALQLRITPLPATATASAPLPGTVGNRLQLRVPLPAAATATASAPIPTVTAAGGSTTIATSQMTGYTTAGGSGTIIGGDTGPGAGVGAAGVVGVGSTGQVHT